MSLLSAFSLTELAAFIGVALAAMTALMATCFKSRCDEINCCWGAMQCHRMVPPVPPRPTTELTGASEPAQENLRNEQQTNL